jgi:hypothetical protein
MSFTHDTLINALRDVIREEIRTLAVDIARDESSDFAIELTRQIEMLIESNGTVTSMEDQSSRLLQIEDSLGDHDRQISNLEDEMPDTNDIERRLDDLEAYVSENDVDDIVSDVNVLKERTDRMKHALIGISDATGGFSYT